MQERRICRFLGGCLKSKWEWQKPEEIAHLLYYVNVTIQNYDCGLLVADLVVILKDNNVEVARGSAYLSKYIWQTTTFSFRLFAMPPAGGQSMTVELFWNDLGNMKSLDNKSFTVNILDAVPTPTPSTLPSPTPTSTPVTSIIPSPSIIPTPTSTHY